MAKYEILNNITHKDLTVNLERSADLGDNVWYAVTFPSEFRSVQRHYPIFFIKHSETGEFQPAAMFGVEQGENLFLEADGWNASYIPLNILRQPFLIALQKGADGQEESVVSVDIESPRINSGQGEPVFLEHGGHSPYLERVTSILKALGEGTRETRPFFEVLEAFDLIESFVLDAQLDDGSEHRLAGFYTISEEALRELDEDKLSALHRRGFLEPIYMVIASMTNLPLLLDRKNQRRQAEQGHAVD
jgi:hypothetical protein